MLFNMIKNMIARLEMRQAFSSCVLLSACQFAADMSTVTAAAFACLLHALDSHPMCCLMPVVCVGQA